MLSLLIISISVFSRAINLMIKYQNIHKSYIIKIVYTSEKIRYPMLTSIKHSCTFINMSKERVIILYMI